ncbi:MAG: prolipoprotein diacylglyceryl transferase [Flavobacteriaceae bacterium]|nr:prolipoprotein diacylglyceryl transferase [Flavobacteriaceae bacterium]|tara:strand:+ start:2969 stop:3820 length:852 start_codon:yes stop_codon:yes gene_type:complete
MIYNKIKWEPSETIFKIGDFGIHYYSLMFVLAFTIGYYLMKRMFNKEKISEEFIEPLLVYVVFSTLIGARLGEVFFYNWDYYSNHLIEILLPIREKENGGFLFGLLNNYEFIGFRGLASHGASIGIILGLYIYQRKYNYKPLLWLLDRLSIPVSLGAFFVRIGNFFNSEIVGKYTGNNFGVIFINRGETLPRHPTQLYESFGYLILFLILNYFYKNRENNNGYLFGIFLSSMFTIRFIVEFLKESQGGFESKLTLFSTGQWLSIPMILSGLFIIIYSFKKLKS